MKVSLLGPLVAHDDAGVALRLGGPKQRAVLALLALSPGRVLPMDTLVDGLWEEDPPARAVGTIQVYVHGLRKALGDPGLIRNEPPGYLLAPGVTTDVGDLAALRARAEDAEARGDLASALGAVEAAAALWRGAPLADLSGFAFARNAAVELEETRIHDLEELHRLQLDLGRHREVLPRLEALVAEHPTREALWRLLILALYRSERQGDALAAFRRVREALADELGIDPGPGLRDLELAILRQDESLAPPVQPEPAPITVAPVPATVVPRPAHALVGRAQQVADVLALVHNPDVGLVTLIGPGGVGKTRTALEVAHRLVDVEVVFVDASGAQDADAVLRVAGQALGLTPDASDADGVAERLAGRALVVLDNLEQARGAGAFVSDLLARAPGVTVLATSRVALRISAEHVVPVDTLGLADAVDLFAARARAAAPTFSVDDHRDDVVALCERLDRLPLALEIAAARVRMIAPGAMLERLQSGLDRLGAGLSDLPERQRTIEATVAWSLDLLPVEVRRACARLTVLADGFSMAAAAELVGDDPDRAVDSLSQLIDSSLALPVEEPGEARFRLFSAVAEVAAREVSPQQRAELERLHAEWYATHLLDTVPALDGPEHERTIRSLVQDDSNLLRALATAVRTGDGELTERLVLGLVPYWIASGRGRVGFDVLTGHVGESTSSPVAQAALCLLAYHATDWPAAIQHATEALSGLGQHPELAARVRCHRAAALLVTDQVEEGRAEAERAAREAEVTDVYDVRVLSLSTLAIAAAITGDFEAERELYQRRLALARGHADRARTVDTLGILAEIAVDAGDRDAARRHAAEALDLAADWMPAEQRDLLIVLARLAIADGDLPAAREHLRQALEITGVLGETFGLAQVLRTAAGLALAESRHVVAARLVGASELLLEHTRLAEGVEVDLTGVADAVRVAMTDAHHREELAAGRALHRDDVLRLARDLLATGSSSAS